jgi:hypothetical protein
LQVKAKITPKLAPKKVQQLEEALTNKETPTPTTKVSQAIALPLVVVLVSVELTNHNVPLKTTCKLVLLKMVPEILRITPTETTKDKLRTFALALSVAKSKTSVVEDRRITESFLKINNAPLHNH